MAKYLMRGGVFVHRFVWESQHGQIPKGYHVHHINEDVTDNCITNLELLSNKDHPRVHNARYKKVKGIWMKRCRYCKVYKPLKMFGMCGGHYIAVCKKCYPKYLRDSYAKDPARYRDYQKRYKKAHPDKIKEANKRYYEEHIEELRKKKREYMREYRLRK